MGYGVKLHVWGDYACFTRPEMKAERVSYDVMTPSAARGILEAIHWKPSLRWVVDRIHVLNEIRLVSIQRNEARSKISGTAIKSAMNGTSHELRQNTAAEREQRMTVMLYKPAYIIEAHFELTDRKGEEDTEEKHYNIFLRRARKGQCFQQPYLGCKEFAASFRLIEFTADMPQERYYKAAPDQDLQWMLWDMEYGDTIEPKFFRAVMRGGVIEVPDLRELGRGTR